MKVLIINNHLYSSGGDSTYAFAVGKMLKKNGHEVAYWGTHHSKNKDFFYKDYFPPFIDYNELSKKQTIKNSIKVLKRSIYYKEARSRLIHVLKHFQPDIVHLNNIHAYLTPSIIDAIYANRKPIIWTLHDYKLLCPDSHFLSHGKICQKCLGNKFYMCTLNKCKKDSYPASLMASMEAYFHKTLNIYNKIDYFIAPSEFLKEKFIEGGWKSKKFKVLRNFSDKKPTLENNNNSNYILYFGRLEKIKGVYTLIKATTRIDSKILLKIVGEGHDKKELEAFVKLSNCKNIEFCGYKSGNELDELIKNSLFIIVPSEWYENCPYTIIEGMSFGKPVIGSDLGGIKELVKDKWNGLLFKHGDNKDLSKKINYLLNNRRLIEKYSQNALEFATNNFNSDLYYNKLTKLYYKSINV